MSVEAAVLLILCLIAAVVVAFEVRDWSRRRLDKKRQLAALDDQTVASPEVNAPGPSNERNGPVVP